MDGYGEDWLLIIEICLSLLGITGNVNAMQLENDSNIIIITKWNL